MTKSAINHGPARTGRLTAAWLALIGLTLAGGGLAGLQESSLAHGAVLALAAIKGRCVALRFMGLEHAPAWLRRTVLGWLFGVVGFIAFTLI
ncbi:MAG: cytochrome C oxidase subunit IV family protein [Methyloversatilis sp.]|jgi:hypothetical protein|uniref:cytochrome C oxidase subunit IV family protein n=1 Tax=unclassified Methyloversatilis TaxID=2639971 RepID=UPI000DB3E24F|nr:cytochrome C oxidase subunit IV family protein [Methyloversatilis sp.]MCR6665268.1 cytochrome C oxidase subunit IV family protein [Methyloversatilis sp.]PZU50914.1 MAG: hypothetical protein DI561_17260 [Thauera sp.]